MNSFDASIWLVIALGILLANVPFFTRRVFGVVQLKTKKGAGWHLFELLLYYFAFIAMGVALESKLGQRNPQNWEFYAITLAVFFTLAFPGFVYKHLSRSGRLSEKAAGKTWVTSHEK